MGNFEDEAVQKIPHKMKSNALAESAENFGIGIIKSSIESDTEKKKGCYTCPMPL